MGYDVEPAGPGSPLERGGEADLSADPEAAEQVSPAKRRAESEALRGLDSAHLSAEAAQYSQATKPETARYGRALNDVNGVGDAKAAQEFIERYLQPDSWERTGDRRGELLICLLGRIPQIFDASDADEQAEVFRAMLNVACGVPDHQYEALAALAEASRNVPTMARQLRADISMQMKLLRIRRVVDDSGYVRIHAKLARSIVSAVPFDEPLPEGFDSGGGPQTSDYRAELSSLSGWTISNESDAKEMALLLQHMLGVVREMPVEQKGAWLTALAQATGCLSRYPQELAKLFDPMLKEVTPWLANKDRSGLLTALAEISRHLPRSASRSRTQLLAGAQAAWQHEAIDDGVHAEILAATLPFAAAAADSVQLDRFADAIAALPPEFRGRLYGALFSPNIARGQPEVMAEACFKKAWEGLTSLELEHAKEGIKTLSGTGRLLANSSLGGTIVKSMLDKIEESPDSQWHPLLLRAMAPIIAFPSFSAISLLERELSMIDASAPVKVSDFLLSPGYWMAAHCARIFDRMYPLVMALSNETERASGLADLAVLLQVPKNHHQSPDPSEEPKDRQAMLAARFNQIVDGLASVKDMSLRSAPLMHARELADELPSSQRSNVLVRLQKLSADDARR